VRLASYTAAHQHAFIDRVDAFERDTSVSDNVDFWRCRLPLVHEMRVSFVPGSKYYGVCFEQFLLAIDRNQEAIVRDATILG
jgi:hypothetical protein